jgi:hypothetical protein
MNRMEERIRKRIGEAMRELGSRSFYVRTRPLGGRTLGVQIRVERDVLRALVERRDALKGIRRTLRGLEEELGTEIREEFRSL